MCLCARSNKPVAKRTEKKSLIKKVRAHTNLNLKKNVLPSVYVRVIIIIIIALLKDSQNSKKAVPSAS